MLAELCAQFEVHANQISEWRRQLLDNAAHVFGKGEIAERKSLIDKSHELPITKQAKLLGISRGAVYYEARPIKEADLILMRRIDWRRIMRWRSCKRPTKNMDSPAVE